MKNKIYLVVIALTGAMAGFSQAAQTGDMAMQNTMLKQRLDQLDREVQALRQSAGQQGAVTGTSSHMPVWSNLDIQLYGYLKLDASYDSSRISIGDYARWVDIENQNDDDNQFDMTARETRLGMLLNGPTSGGMETSGRVELDFYGPGFGIAENQARLMMRHAYVTLDWPQERFSIIAGQTSDVISPLIPTTINYSVLWWVGNIGYRRPQIRLTKEYSLSSDVDLKLEGAAVRTIGRTSVTGEDSGADAGFPTFQGRVSVTLPVYEQQLTTIGLSGHKGEEEYDYNAQGDSKDFDTWSINMDLTQPINDKLLVRGEIFTGRDLDAYLGGIGQGVTIGGAHNLTGIGSSGGWVEATYDASANTQLNLGYSMEDVHEGNVNVGDRTENRTFFGNVIYALNQQTDIGLELSHWRTEYRGPGDAESMRIEAAVKYKF
jgi:hypothetical protein